MKPATFAVCLFIAQVGMMATGALWTVLTTDPNVGHKGRLASIVVMAVLVIINGLGAAVTHFWFTTR